MDKKIIVLGGGESTEREVSLRSSAAVMRALQTEGFTSIMIDTAKNLSTLASYSPNDVYVLPILHGEGGEDGTIQFYLESRGYTYLGTDAMASTVTFDKSETRKVLKANGLPVADGETVTRHTYANSRFAQQPHVLKACNGGSSIGTIIVDTPPLNEPYSLNEVFDRCETAVIEELVMGTEITVSIFGDRALPVIEIIPPDGKRFDYTNKYNGSTQELCPPVSLSESLQHTVQTLAVDAHNALNCRHLSRVDMIVRDNGVIVILELNTMPGMTDQSLYPKAALVAGMSFPVLIRELIKGLS